MGSKLHLKLNTGTRPIENKYHEGKVKSTLKRVKHRWEGNERGWCSDCAGSGCGKGAIRVTQSVPRLLLEAEPYSSQARTSSSRSVAIRLLRRYVR